MYTKKLPIALVFVLLLYFGPASIMFSAQAAEPGNTVNEVGVIAARSYDGVWSAPYSGPSGTYITQGIKYDNQQVQIVQEAQTSYGTYEQFTVNGNVVGWLDKKAFRTISPITAVSKAGVIQTRNYDGIWSNPYASPQGNTWIAMGTNYNKKLVQINGEAQTPYGSYEQFSVDGKTIGWLDSRAFGVIGQISSNNSVNNIGTITARAYDGVWEDPYMGAGTPYAGPGTNYNSWQVQIVQEAQTSYGTYEQFSVNGNVVGWLDKKAFSSISPINAVNKTGVIQAHGYDGIWANPYGGLHNNTWIAMGTNYNNQLVQINREAQTPYGSYEQFSVNGRTIGWLDSRAFGVIGQLNSNNTVNNTGSVEAASYDGVWADPYLGPGTPNKGQGISYNGWQVQINREARTSYGTYEQFSANGQTIGWLDKKAFSSINPISDVSKAGVIKARSYDGIWASPYGGKQGNTWVGMGTNYNNQFVQITREAKTPYGLYEQITIDGKVIGWLDSSAFSVIGQLNVDQAVNNVGIINASYDGVWKGPYMGPETPYVGQGSNYNGRQVEITREAQTSYGTYEQFSINGQVIGWLDKKAFSSISKTYYNNAVTNGGIVRSRSYDGVWANPYTGESNTLVASGGQYDGQFVKIVHEAKTVCGTYEQFEINDQVIGWLDAQAFSPINELNNIHSVSSTEQVSAASSDSIWGTPYLGKGSPYLGKGTSYNGKQVQVIQEAQTSYGTYEQFSVNGRTIGWLDKKAFLSTSALAKGIDIASYQNTTPINFNLVRQSGINFIIAKATEGTTYLNDYFYSNIAAAQSAGLQASAYHFFRASNTNEAKSEADYFAAALKKANIDGYAFVDVETTNNCSRSALTNNVNAFLQKLKSDGITKIGIYSYVNFFNTDLYLSSIRQSNPDVLVWTAWYSGNPNSDIWQYTSSGEINGITGRVDLDYSYAYRF